MAASYRFNWNDREVSRRVLDAADGAMKVMGHTILAASNRIVPHREGHLQRSGTVIPWSRGVAVVYRTPYAAKQHEETGYRHKPGRQAKYLITGYRKARRQAERKGIAYMRRKLR